MELIEICKKAKKVKYEIQCLTTKEKNDALLAVADKLVAEADSIIAANAKDYERGVSNGMHKGLLDRLLLDKKRIEAMAEGLRQVAALPDPIGEVIDSFSRPNGLQIKKVRVPMGVIGIIYEARPNVTADAFALTFKAGNAVVLKGGSDAIDSNIQIANVMRAALSECGINPDAIQLIEDTDRAVTTKFMQMNEYIDVLIPRGSARLINAVVENSTIPVIETGTGNCHIYVDKDADIDKAIPIIINAKTQRIGVCNAAESLVVHEDIKDKFLPLFEKAMNEHNVEIRGDEESRKLMNSAVSATEEDFGKEFLDYIISVKTVKNVDEAIDHINKYNTSHSDAIVTENEETAKRFLERVDSACVYVNASTRFTDGFEFGFGAEIGISTQKLHARGPMGLKELTSYKYQIVGEGQIR
ncbi:glutamate-5-semialdehyde dehydrogenase [Butyrivibrio hungatei]|jgi:glutamate-5-semialdehyde dehydrogenase|uniref:Gamma-glutamyl phosphate reductase n=1 Tax=Butyrivibrio hungatei TaxID=185008 RepID=A0A1G5B513_9FIRM|nr:glutamate-5-semialdehyde dehydrogenase [Butyrivibrio hungatei]MBQ4218621.1 glutamate-5-semialdehyde dehydrogenase [Butyrivibrio sp.]MBR4639126.1 glutamate-5-semialdehyde dehydrogenase [Butyrivibrio sp.]MEE3469944.1 glutamate-5-semialdehyde dehydrogenase [Butyrivibrio hungatei]SCX85258.1 glutamate-5-semialdehyde dehydrogenase [Butyrivibrio hungatei]